MEDINYTDIDRRIHDETFIESIERREKLKKLIVDGLNISDEQLKDEATIAVILLQLLREKSILIKGLYNEIGIFFCEWLEDSEDEVKEEYRAIVKNNNYNRVKAKQYIDTYWDNYNPAYPTFHGGGGDCANFVSQVVYAGGMKWVDDGNPSHYTWFTNWYCKPGATNRDGDRKITLSWKVAAAFRRHWEKRSARQILIKYRDAISDMEKLSRELYIGDPVQFCYANGVAYHTLIVTGFAWDKAAGVNDIVLASHTIDSNKRSLYNTMLKYPDNYLLRVYVIKDGE
ncbi:MAG: amidase domain-containing protein [Lutisporaceae bacterium]